MLTFYKRHKKSCFVHTVKLSKKAKREHMACDCPIWMYGRVAGAVVPQQSTGTNDLATAEELRKKITAGEKETVKHGPRIDDCCTKYIASRKHELGDKTAGQFKLHLGRLVTFCAARGVEYMNGLTVDLLEDFKVEGFPEAMADTSKATAVNKLRAFLKVAFRRGWIATHLAEKVSGHKAIYEQKEPYSDDEVTAILEWAAKLNGGTHGYASQPATFRLLLELMLETGMRAGDAIRYNPAVATKGDVLWCYSFVMQKRKKIDALKPHEVFISPKLKTAIDSCKWLSTSKPFHFGASDNPSYLANEVYERMQTIGTRAGVADCRPHRLRDTFAVRCLLRGLTIDQVSRLLGHSSVKVTETYYAKWTVGRRRQLESIVAQSFGHAPEDALRNTKSAIRSTPRSARRKA